jgi:hypothetical protein
MRGIDLISPYEAFELPVLMADGLERLADGRHDCNDNPQRRPSAPRRLNSN